ncbi:MAG: glycosyltransferase family 2 protein [Acidobacteria bacterium]|nr:glycosyltransferase family 2 protein [Acidobacteriota bacterium]
MKLVIQIPAWNEESSLGETLEALPDQIEGFDTIDVHVVDDGSRDRTADVARQHGVRVVSLEAHRGLAVAFETGVKEALRRGADVIVNTDADNQYDARDIANLVRPILDGRADMVIGDRQVGRLKHFSLTKRILQRLGSWLVRRLSRTDVRDATSGFRAISRQAALRLHVFTRFTYTLETILQAGEAGFRVVSVPVRVNPNPHRKSRLFRSNIEYVIRSLESLARIVVLYNPLRIFLRVGFVPVVVGGLLLARFGWLYVHGQSPAGHVQSLLLAVILIVTGVQICVLGLVADLIAVNRRLVEEIEYRERDRLG